MLLLGGHQTLCPTVMLLLGSHQNLCFTVMMLLADDYCTQVPEGAELFLEVLVEALGLRNFHWLFL
eukprot:4083325-Karenia_brevis.AAC.1